MKRSFLGTITIIYVRSTNNFITPYFTAAPATATKDKLVKLFSIKLITG